MMDRTRVRYLRAKILKALEEALQGENLSIVPSNGSFFPDKEYRLNFVFKINNGETVVASKLDESESIFLETCHLYGFKKEDLGRLLILKNGRSTLELTLAGIRPNARNDKVFIGKTVDGKVYILTKKNVDTGLLAAQAEGAPKQPKTELVVPKPKSGKRSEEFILTDIRNVNTDLEPENLTEDGELTGAFLERKRKALETKLASLIAELGRKPTEEELEI